MYNHILYFYYWLVNALVLLVFKVLLPGEVVLGNWRFSSVEAAVYSGFWITFWVWLFWDWALGRRIDLSRPLVNFIYFFTVNIFAIWLVARFAHWFGLGITSYFWAIVLGLAAYFLQQWVRGKVVAGSSH